MNKYTFKTFLQNFINLARITIIDLVKKEIANEDKKKQLDLAIKTFIISTLATAKLGWLTKLLIERLILPHISELTQAVYDLIKMKVDGVTK